MKVIAVAGIPGAGKSTVAMALADAIGARVVSPGDAARAAGDQSVRNGGMADEKLVRDYVARSIREAKKDIILDGFPRTFAQYVLLPPDTTLVRVVTEERTALDRLSARGREDDTPDLVVKRVHEQSALLEGWLADATHITVWNGADMTREEVGQYAVRRLDLHHSN